ncbi:dnaJ (Hsp40) homolog, subfamily C, member 5 gamma b [Hypomesus transpacificus]|uniref:dnaJ (Hsp40) homolog, subfamily C, member 5 gamma b n=1 Tax=Hypomesus transpacificus TaxID=137520 RepID=UPI001F081C55|nr:dnaJ (Hsp40) homolog, subfamily C, member 5 gamma b [Hypomesus transpacificus]
MAERSIPHRRMSTEGVSLYMLMELEKGATAEQIKKAYRKLALKYHPDKNPNNPEAAEKFKEINNANTILNDDTKRKIYDEYGSMGLNIAEQFGDESVKYYFLMSKCWFKTLMYCCCFFTGCCCCCCCCFCCFSCGRGNPNEEDFGNIDPDELEAQIRAEQERAGDTVIVAQPSPSEATVSPETVIVIQPGPNEGTVSGENEPIVIQPHMDITD